MQEIQSHHIQQQILGEIGSELHQQRQQRGLSLETIARTTLIQKRLLEALETGDLHTLPEPVYIRGLLQRYGDALGLTGESLAQRFPVEMPPKKKKVWARLRWPGGWQIHWQLHPSHLYGFYVLLILLSVQNLSGIVKKSAIEGQTLTPPIAPRLSSQAPTKDTMPVARLAAHGEGDSLVRTTPNNPVTVSIYAKENAWVRVMVDGKEKFEGTLAKGTQRSWTAGDSLTLRTGNAGAVLVAFNNQQAKQLGQPGEVQEVTYQAREL